MRNKASDVISKVVSKIVEIAKTIPSKISNAIKGAVSKVGEWGTNMLDKAKTAMQNVVNGIKGKFKNIGSDVKSIGKDMVEGIWKGISGATDWIEKKIKGWVGDVTKFLKKVFGIKSPSTLMRDEIGVYLAQGIGVGFEEGMSDVEDIINNSIPKEFDVNPKVVYDSSEYGPINSKERKVSTNSGFVVNQYIYANETSYEGQQKAAAKQFKIIARAV